MKNSGYTLPSDLFPDRSIIEAVADHKNALERELRTVALKGYAQQGSPDRELQRFIAPALSWGSWLGQETPFHGITQLGNNSWIATPESAPEIPHEFHRIAQICQEPRSLIHLVAATYSRMRILYITEDLENVSLSKEVLTCEFLLVIVAPGVTVSFSDELVVDEFAVRSLIGIVHERAHVTLSGDHVYAPEAYGLQHDRWYLGVGATLSSHELFTGSKQSWLRKEFILARDAELQYSWLAALNEDQQVALTTVQEHQGAASKSSVMVKAALSGYARSFYRGMIRLDEQSSQANADQQQRALMLSDEARVCAIPALEVATHDVQCAHGSAAGRFNEQELQYLRSRGCTSAQAQHLLLEGFFNEPFVSETALKRLQEQLTQQR